MLSIAKHLLFLVENKQKQIPRFVRDDNRWDLFHRPASLGVHRASPPTVRSS
jgi:hypothetical protein